MKYYMMSTKKTQIVNFLELSSDPRIRKPFEKIQKGKPPP
jgi:hypothetical protein